MLCGVKSLTLMDNQNVTEDDYTAQFLIPRADLGKNVRLQHLSIAFLCSLWLFKTKQKNNIFSLFSFVFFKRAKACLARAQRLNPMVEIRTDVEEIKTKDSKFFKDFDVVILTGCALDVMVINYFKTFT